MRSSDQSGSYQLPHQDDAEAPQVAALTVSLPTGPGRHFQDLGCCVLEQKSQGQLPRVELRLQASKSKLDNLDLGALLTLGVEKEAFGLKVSVHRKDMQET